MERASSAISPKRRHFLLREWRSNPSTFPRPRARPSQDPWRPSAARFLWPSRRGTRTSTRRTTTPATSPGAPSSATFSRRRLSRVSNEISSRAPDPDVDRVGGAAPSRPGFGGAPNDPRSEHHARSTHLRQPRAPHAGDAPRTGKGFLSAAPSSLTTPPERFLRELSPNFALPSRHFPPSRPQSSTTGISRRPRTTTPRAATTSSACTPSPPTTESSPRASASPGRPSTPQPPNPKGTTTSTSSSTSTRAPARAAASRGP